MHPIEHAAISVAKFGGKPEDYLPIHLWFDESRGSLGDIRHRALRHHTEGIMLCEKIFGITIRNSDGKDVPVRYIGTRHVQEDLGSIPTAADWLRNLKVENWMFRGPIARVSMTNIPIEML